MLDVLKTQARQLRQHTLTVYFVARDPRTPLIVRGLAVLVAAYALSPIDLIPDFIPVIGLLRGEQRAFEQYLNFFSRYWSAE